MADQFPLPRSGFKVLRLILIGYLHEGGRDRKAVGPPSVGKAVGMDPTIVSRNNAFLAAIGLIESEQRGRWRLTQPGSDVAKAFEYEASDELQDALAPVLRANDFTSRVLTFIRSRNGVDESQLVQHIARTAGVPRKSDFMTGSRALVELMVEAGVVIEDGGVISPGRAGRAATATVETPAESGEAGGRHISGAAVREAERRSPRQPEVTVTLNLTAADLKSDAAVDALAARVRRLLDAVGGDVARADAN